MKINKRTQTILISITLIVLIAGGIFLVMKKNQVTKDNETPTSSTKEDISKNESAARDQQSKLTNNQSTSNDNSNISVVITGFTQNPDGIAVLGTIVNGATNGTCTATFTKDGGSTIVRTAPIGLQVSYYICKGFNDIPSSSFNPKGQWMVVVSVNSSQGTSDSESKFININ